MPQVTDNFYHIMLYWIHFAWSGFKPTTLKVIDTNCIVSCKSIYHTIRTTTALFYVIHNLSIPDLILRLFWQIFHMSYFPFGEQNGRTTERTRNLRICFKNIYSYFNLVKEVNFRGNFKKITSCYNIKLYTKYYFHWNLHEMYTFI